MIGPLRREWEAIAGPGEGADDAPGRRPQEGRRTPRRKRLFDAFLDRLRSVRILDPPAARATSCTSPSRRLKDLELEAIGWGSLVLREPQQFPRVGPEAVMGIEINAYAAELARVTIWIGEIQWMLNHGFHYRSDPVLQPLDTIECRDALLDLVGPDHPREAEWPAAEFIVGNPPFLGANCCVVGLAMPTSKRRNILEDLFTGPLDWSLADVNYQVDYADLLLTRLGVKHLLVEVKRPGSLAWNRHAVDAALVQAAGYARKPEGRLDRRERRGTCSMRPT